MTTTDHRGADTMTTTDHRGAGTMTTADQRSRVEREDVVSVELGRRNERLITGEVIIMVNTGVWTGKQRIC